MDNDIKSPWKRIPTETREYTFPNGAVIKVTKPAGQFDDSDTNDGVTENVSELPPAIIEAPVHTDTSVTDSEQPSIETLTAEIKMYLHIANQSIIEVGKRLIQAKELVPHGDWLNWLKLNFNLGYQTADKFIQIAERFGKSRVDTTFGSTQLIALLSLPEGEEQNFLSLKSADLKAFGADKLGLSNPDMDAIIKKLRADNSNICKLWRNVESDSSHSVNFKSPTVSFKGRLRTC